MSRQLPFTEGIARATARHRRRVLDLGVVLLAVVAAVGCAGADDSTDRVGASGATPPTVVVGGAALDAHTHLMSANLATRMGATGTSTAADLIDKMDEARVERAVVLSTAYMSLLPDDASVSAENDFTASEVARYPDRLIGFCGVNPLRAAAVEEIDRCTSKPGMRGLKLHLAGSQLHVENDQHLAALTRVFDRADQLSLPVLIHVGDPIGLPLDSAGLAKFGEIVATHPNVRLTFAHCFSLLDNQQLEIMAYGMRQGLFRPEQLFIDVSACLSESQDAPLSERELIVWRLRKFGLDRVLFGSDYLSVDPTADTPANALKTLAAYPFTQSELDSILGNDGSGWLVGE